MTFLFGLQVLFITYRQYLDYLLKFPQPLM